MKKVDLKNEINILIIELEELDLPKRVINDYYKTYYI